MAEQNCNRFLDYSVKLVSHRRSFSHCFSVLNFAFSLVATVGNLLVICALMKIQDTVKKLFLSLAFSDLAVELCSQLITAISYCRDVEDGIKWRRLSLLLSNSFDCAFIFSVSSRHCIFPGCYCHCI